MKKIIYILIINITTFFILASHGVCQQQKEMGAPIVIPPATGEMQHAGFWVNRLENPDRVIMTPEQIKEFNRKNRSRPMAIKDINGNPYSIENILRQKDYSTGLLFTPENPLTMKSFTGDSLRVRIERHNRILSGSALDRRRIKYLDIEKQKIIDGTNKDKIPETITPRYGILVKHTLNRIIPLHEGVFGSPTSFSDRAQSAGLEIGMPVAVLYMSRERDWYYAKSALAFGWIPAENVAFASPEVIERYINAENFIVSLDHKVPVYSAVDKTIHIVDFYMGAKLKLLNKTDEGYKVIVPARAFDGSLIFIPGLVLPDAPVSIGYQPYTQRNIFKTTFRLNFRPYGWADSNNERDCCGTTRAVLRTFGFKMGRWTTHQLHSTDHVNAFPASTSREIKYKILDSCEPGICLIGNGGHIIMYLGKVDGVYYVIHQNGWSYKTEDGTTMHVRRMSVNSTEVEPGSHVNRWTEISEIKP